MSRSVRNGEGAALLVASPPQVFGKCPAARPKWRAFYVLAALAALVCAPCGAQQPIGVQILPQPVPPLPNDAYCTLISDELTNDLNLFNATIPSAPPYPSLVNSIALQWANADTGPQISNPGCAYTTINSTYNPSNCTYLPTVLAQLQEANALGVTGVGIPILFPVLYGPFWGKATDTNYAQNCQSNPPPAACAYLAFYQLVRDAVRNNYPNLKIIVDDEILFSNDIQAGINTTAFYSSLTWPEYVAARANMAAIIAKYIQPDFLVIANEPDTEAVQTGQSNLNNPVYAAQMVQAEITAIQALNLPNPPKLGAGFGTWMSLPVAGVAPYTTPTLGNYIYELIQSPTAPPLDYIDFHVIPINTINGDNFLQNAMTIANAAAAAGKPVAMGQAAFEKVADIELAGGYSVSDIDVQRARQTFSFWQPLDTYYIQVMENLANYEQMVYLDYYNTWLLSAYQTYGGLIATPPSTNCMCVSTATGTDCSDYDMMQFETSLAGAADQTSAYTDYASNYYHMLVNPTGGTPDTTPPTAPPGLALVGTPGYTTANLTWNASSDNIGVAGYAVFRCTPPASGQPCTGVQIANTALPGYIDTPLNYPDPPFSGTPLVSGTLYNYQVEAFDFAGNFSQPASLPTILTVATTSASPTGLTATVKSPSEISLSWTAPTTNTPVSEYQIYRGASAQNMQQIGIRPTGTTTYNDLNLVERTTYYYGVVAMEAGVASPMSTETYATTLPLPPPPSNVAVGTNTKPPSLTPTTIQLTWQQNILPGGLPIASYQIFQSTTPGVYPTTHGSSTTTTYTAKSLTPNTTYYFEIVAEDKPPTGVPPDYSAPSNQIAVTTLLMPAAPVITSASAISCTKVTIKWTESVPSNALPIQDYTVYRSSSSAGPWTTANKIGSAAATAKTYTDSTAMANTTYYYAITMTDTGQDISPVAVSGPVTTPIEPAAPFNVKVATNSETQLTVTWSETIPVPAGALPISNYTVNWGSTPALGTSVTRTTQTFAATGLKAGTPYYFAVKANDSGGDSSPWTATVQGTTAVPPPAPVIGTLQPNGSGTQIVVPWSETSPPAGMPQISSFTIYGGPSLTGPWTSLATRGATTFSYTQTGLTPGLTYCYYIKATDTGQDTSSSAAACVTTP